MSFRAIIETNELTPVLARLLAKAEDERRVILDAVGGVLVSITFRAFTEEALRPQPWPAKRDGTPSRLIASGTLRRSIRIVSITSNSVEVGTDRVYAAIHQTGGVIRPKAGKALRFQIAPGQWVTVSKVTIPARPYFPITASGQLTPTALDAVLDIIQVALAA